MAELEKGRMTGEHKLVGREVHTHTHTHTHTDNRTENILERAQAAREVETYTDTQPPLQIHKGKRIRLHGA